MKGTRPQFEAVAQLLKDSYGGYLGDISDSQFEGVMHVSVEHDDQRDGKWTEHYLIGADGAKIKVPAKAVK
jgi:hypothetical protein